MTVSLNRANSPYYPADAHQFNLSPNQAEIYFLKPSIAAHVGTLFLSDTTNTKVEVTNSNVADLTPGTTGGPDTGLWVQITNAAEIKLDATYTAVKITNTLTSGNTTIRVDLAI